MSDRIAVIGLGYVGLPVALAFAKKFHTIGFDINRAKVQALKQCIDSTGEIDQYELKNSNLKITDNLEDLATVNFFIVAVPTPIDRNHRPDLASLIQASNTIGKVLKPGTIVVYESTVYPGVTEDICGKILAEVSGLRQSIDFKLGYSPERINPGYYIGQRLVKLLVQANLPIKGAKVGILGLTFKENVPDLRNSRVPDIITELEQFGIKALVHDSIANSEEVEREYGINLVSLSQLVDLDALIFTVNHQFYLDSLPKLISCLSLGGVFMGIKSAIEPDTIAKNIIYWSL